PVLSLMLHAGVTRDDSKSLAIVRQTLDAMAQGGIHDQLAGGFHRYTTDSGWSVPHFEKMLYDNAQLLRLYADAYRLTGNANYRRIAAGVADYLVGRMLAADGGFYTAEDAAVDGVEGASYLWTQRELVAVLGTEAAKRFLAAYALTPIADQARLQTPQQTVAGEEYGVLRLRLPIEESLARTGSPDINALLDKFAPMRSRLLEFRERRKQPARDEKIVVGQNGLAIGAFAASAGALDRPKLLDIARRSAERIYRVAYDPQSGQLKHEIFKGRAQTDAYLDDYALLGNGLLALHAATGEKLWLQRASSLADSMLARFARADGTLATTPAEKDLLIPPPEQGDPIVPSGTSAAVDLLLQLGKQLGEQKYSSSARRVVERHSARLDESAGFWSVMVAALNFTGLGAGATSSVALDKLDTARHVRVSANGMSGPDQDEIAIVLDIERGYHVNANPASYDYLIPTQVEFPGLTPVALRYPKATLFKPAFEPAGLEVFEGTVEIRAQFPKGTLARERDLRAVVWAQACDDEICLPPAKIPVTVQITE
ncbi:MAG: thioredoxin domain-containing protein, partial [Burkholderiales bacterium]